MGRSRRPGATLVPVEEQALAQARTSIVEVPIGNRIYPAERHPDCPVCSHPGRGDIEERILFNEGFTDIVRFVSAKSVQTLDGREQAWPELTVAHVSRHFRRGHCPINATVLHELTRQRQPEIDYDTMAGRAVDEVVLAQQVVARVQERLVRGETEPSVKEGLAAAKLIASVKAAGASDTELIERVSYLEQAMDVYFGTAREIMPPEMYDDFIARLIDNPVLAQLMQPADPADQPEEGPQQ